MPNRVLKVGIITSEAVNSLSPQAELFYRRLMSVVDDWGRYDGRVSILRPACYPLQLDQVREANVQRWLAECEKARLVRLYNVEGKPYVQMLKWDKPRAKASKWPNLPPPGSVQAHVDMCAHMRPDTDTGTGSNTGTSTPTAAPVGADHGEGEAKERPKELHSVQKVVLWFKHQMGIPEDDVAWDKVYFPRYSKPSKQVLSLFEDDIEMAFDCIESVVSGFEKKGLTWTPETVAKHAGDWKHGRFMK